MQKYVGNFAQSIDDLSSVIDTATAGLTWQDFVVALVIVILSIPISKLIATITRKIINKSSHIDESVSLWISKAIRGLIIIFALAIAASYLGFNIGLLSLFIALGMVILVLMVKPLIENTASGLLLQTRPAFGVKDYIQTKKYRGIVIEINARTTVLKTIDNRRVHIPNDEVLADTIVVYSGYDSLRSSLELVVNFEADLKEVTEIITNGLLKIEGIHKTPEPLIQASGFGDNSYRLNIIWWHDAKMGENQITTDSVSRMVIGKLKNAKIELKDKNYIVKNKA